MEMHNNLKNGVYKIKYMFSDAKAPECAVPKWLRNISNGFNSKPSGRRER